MASERCDYIRIQCQLAENSAVSCGAVVQNRQSLMIDFINQKSPKYGRLDGVNFAAVSDKIDYYR